MQSQTSASVGHSCRTYSRRINVRCAGFLRGRFLCLVLFLARILSTGESIVPARLTANCRTKGSQSIPIQYPPARGRYAPRQSVESLYDVRVSVVSGRPTCREFAQAIYNEMRIRKYQPKTIKDYCNNLRNFLKWFGGKPHQVQQADVKANREACGCHCGDQKVRHASFVA